MRIKLCSPNLKNCLWSTATKQYKKVCPNIDTSGKQTKTNIIKKISAYIKAKEEINVQAAHELEDQSADSETQLKTQARNHLYESKVFSEITQHYFDCSIHNTTVTIVTSSM